MKKAATRGAMSRWGMSLGAALAALGTGLVPAVVFAAPAAAVRQREVVRVVMGSLPWGVDAGELRARLAKELGADVVETVPDGRTARGTLFLDTTPEHEICARYEAADGTVTQRTIALPSEHARAEDTIVLVSGNVARDEAAELRAELARARNGGKEPVSDDSDAPPGAADEGPDAGTVAGDAGSDKVPHGSDGDDPHGSDGDDSPPAGAKRPRATPRRPAGDSGAARRPVWSGPCKAPSEAETLFGGDFVPMVGTSIANRNAVRHFSLNVLGGLSGGLVGAEIGSIVNVTNGPVCGLQIGGTTNVVSAPMRGLQIGGLVNVVAGEASGLQIGGLVNVVNDDVSGLQIGGTVNVVTGEMSGLQIGGVVNVVTDRVRGLQIGGVANTVRGGVRGFQIGGVANAVTLGMDGLQIGGVVNVVTGDMRGLQIGGGANIVTGDVRGLQLGAVNVAGKVHGLQLGAVNVADEADFSLGVVNFVRRGRLHLDVWGAETGLFTAAVKHGGRYFHNFYGAGIRPIDGKMRVAFTLGLGGHAPLSDSFYLDVDGLFYTVHRTEDFGAAPALMTQARAVLGLKVARGFAIFAGPSYNVAVAQRAEDTNLSAFGSTVVSAGPDWTVRGWPGFALGAQTF